MKVQITSNHLTVTLNILLGGLTVTKRVLNVTAVITRFQIKAFLLAHSACHCVFCSRKTSEIWSYFLTSQESIANLDSSIANLVEHF